ncbi:MAG: hypothetical protein WC876_08515 [Candidatus Thermoplasmatota archaeon]
MRPTEVVWIQLAAAAAVFVGAFAAWGSLSLIDEQAEVVRRTRWILAGLALAAGASTTVHRRWATFTAAILFLAAGVLAWSEMNYEENQAHHYGVEGTLWGLWSILTGAIAGILASLLRLRPAPAAPPTP